MSTLRNWDPSKISRELVEHYAALGEEIPTPVGGYTCRPPREELPAIPGWELAWIDTRGEGNRGRLVALPRSPRAFAVYREGRILAMSRETGLSLGACTRLFDVSKGVRYGGEVAVWRAAVELMQRVPLALDSSPGLGGGLAAWAHRHLTDACEAARSLSMPRLDAAIKIAQRAII